MLGGVFLIVYIKKPVAITLLEKINLGKHLANNYLYTPCFS